MTQIPPHNPDIINDALLDDSILPNERQQFSEEANVAVRTALDQAMRVMDEGDLSSAAMLMDALPAIADEGEVAHLLPNVPEGARKYIGIDALRRAALAYDEGELAFAPDLSRITFDLSPEKERLLEIGFESGALNGFVIEAYPTLAQIRAMAERRASVTKKPVSWEEHDLLTFPLIEFLGEHFCKRGGAILNKTNQLITLRQFRTADPGGSPLWKLFKDGAAMRGIDPASGFVIDRSSGFLKDEIHTPEYAKLHGDIYYALTRPTLRDVAGRTRLVFTNVSRELDASTKLLNGTGVSTQVQGRGLSAARMIMEEIDAMTHTEFLSLAGAISDPKDRATYPGQNTWEVLVAIDDTHAAYARPTPLGLQLMQGNPGQSFSHSRARSVIR